MLHSLDRFPERTAISLIAGCLLFIPAFTSADDSPDPTSVGPFAGHSVVTVSVNNQQELAAVLQLTNDVWSERIGLGSIDIRVTPEQRRRLDRRGLDYRVKIEDLQPLIDAQKSPGPEDAGFFDAFHRYDAIIAYMSQLADNYPAFAEMMDIGLSLRGRTIWAMRITGQGGFGAKPGVMFISCQHAREWITTMITPYIAEYLLTRYGTDPAVTRLMDQAEWYLIPVVNPDGYEYTWDGARAWRKNRRADYGVDLNRNWAIGWGGEGSSGDPYSQTYRGSARFSEPETQVVRDLKLSLPNVKAHIDIHSYGQVGLWPWGYQASPTPDDATFDYLGMLMVERMTAVHEWIYTAGQSYLHLYPAGGISTDWFYSEGATSFTFELRDTGDYGFVVPPEYIIPTCEEVIPAVLLLTDWATAPLRISFADYVPNESTPSGPRTIELDIESATGGDATITGFLHYRADPGESYDAIPLVPLGGTRFQATLPAVTCPDDPQFYFSARADEGPEMITPLGAPEEPLAAPTRAKILQNPVSRVVCEGQQAVFRVTAGGVGPFGYQWQRNGVNLSGRTSATLVIGSATLADVGQYRVVVSNPCGSVISNQASLDVSLPPVFTTQPVGGTICQTQIMEFSVEAEYAESYQWFKNGWGIPGATGPVLIIEVSQSSIFYCEATNAVCGTTRSESAVVQMIGPITIVNQPQDLTGCSGQILTPYVIASGIIDYQWRVDGEAIPGATQFFLEINPATPSDSGTYDVVLTSPCESITSEPAIVVVEGCGMGDSDHDGDADLVDFAALQRCFTGPGMGPISAGCDVFDFDLDDDVDLLDFADYLFLAGPPRP